jgi:hypothetical protein
MLCWWKKRSKRTVTYLIDLDVNGIYSRHFMQLLQMVVNGAFNAIVLFSIVRGCVKSDCQQRTCCVSTKGVGGLVGVKKFLYGRRSSCELNTGGNAYLVSGVAKRRSSMPSHPTERAPSSRCHPPWIAQQSDPASLPVLLQMGPG